MLVVVVIVALAITSIRLTYRSRRLSLEYELSQEQLRMQRRQAEEAMQAARQLQDEANTLKLLIGLPATTRIDEVRDQYDRDMETFAADVPLQERDYRRLLHRMRDELKQLRAGDSAD
ncbi:MAG TPA: hypothetical protein VMY37_06020 [Thermoguttaceae bacterium]|nr:hypothetical protein [Thermoguttaceae bacterium]